MCKDCGCSAPTPMVPHDHIHDHSAHHHQATTHEHHHGHSHSHEPQRTIEVHERLLSKNDHQAWHNRDAFQRAGVLAVNLLSSPGSGKTKLLERTLTDLTGRLRLGVMVGDLQTDNDARRLRGRGASVTAITTGTLCHLEAEMIDRACQDFKLAELDILFIENVGNLVCPAAFDLGEALRVVVLSTTEGEDKPLKYPLAFKFAQVVIINKIDMAEAAGFDRQTALDNLHQVAPQALVLELSARTGDGMQTWYQCLERHLVATRS